MVFYSMVYYRTVSTRMSYSGSKVQDKGDTRNHVEDPCVYGVLLGRYATALSCEAPAPTSSLGAICCQAVRRDPKSH